MLQNETSDPLAVTLDDSIACSIERSLMVLGERWSPLILRELHYGNHRFADIRNRLGIATNLLSKRLRELTAAGIIETVPYQEEGSRARFEYVLTAAGFEALVMLGAFQQWGDRYLPRHDGPAILRRRRGTGERLRVAFVTDAGTEVALDEVEMLPAS